MEMLWKILKTINPTDAGSSASKWTNVMYLVVAVSASVVILACKYHLPVPNMNCDQVIENVDK